MKNLVTIVLVTFFSNAALAQTFDIPNDYRISGNVSIGTTTTNGHLNIAGSNPNSQVMLHLANTSDSGYSVIRFSNTVNGSGAAYIHRFNSAWTSSISMWEASSIGFYESVGSMNIGGKSSFKVFTGNENTERLRVTENGNVGIGIVNPFSKLHLVAPAVQESSVDQFDANIIVESTGTTRTIGVGASVGFVVPANTDGSNPWQQGRILVTPDNQDSYNASGRMYLQTRYPISGAWDWRNNLVLISNGNVGIGTSNPEAALDVNGNILLRNSTGVKEIFTWDPTDTNWRIGMNQNPGFNRSITTTHVQYLTYAPGISQGFAVGVNGGNSSFEVRGSDHQAFFRGKVGIGTPTIGTHQLAVEGSIGAREVKVQVGPDWPDYVFEEDYELRTLEETKEYISENKHLPEIPSASEMEANGIDLGDMNMKLLKKVEELTIYLIQMDEEIKALKLKNIQLEANITK